MKKGAHRTYLDNPAYDDYMRLDKVLTTEPDATLLLDIADNLDQESLPTYLDAAGWAYAEAALTSFSLTTRERIEITQRAEAAWARGLVNGLTIGEQFDGRYKYEDNEGHRLALNLAFAPLMKSIIVGNVHEETLRQTLRDVSAIADDSRESLAAAEARDDSSAALYHKGLLFELSALMALLYMGDPRYIPMPSTARAGSGLYNGRQTHDISVFNQHWGDIKKVIPIEVKTLASKSARRRYRALIVSGRLRLSVGDTTESSETAEVFSNVIHGCASTEEIAVIEQLSTQLREMLRLYQKGLSAEGIAVSGLTRFHDTKPAAEVYPELDRYYRWVPDEATG